MGCGPGQSWQNVPSFGPNCTTAWWLYPGCLQGGCDPIPCTPTPPCPPWQPYSNGVGYPPPYPYPPAPCGPAPCDAPAPGPWMWGSPWMPGTPGCAPAWNGCAQMLVAGSCCGGCAKGGACDCKVSVPKDAPGTPDVGACGASACGSGGCGAPIVGALYVSDAELDALGSQVALMGADVDVAAAKEQTDFPHKVATGTAMTACHAAGLKWDKAGNKCLQEPDPTGASYIPQNAKIPLTEFQNGRWTPYQLEWNAYRAQTIHEPTAYDILRTRFSTLVDEWRGLGQTTRATIPKPLSESSGWANLPWGWITLGVGIVALPFILPALAGLYLLLTKGKTLGLAAAAA